MLELYDCRFEVWNIYILFFFLHSCTRLTDLFFLFTVQMFSEVWRRVWMETWVFSQIWWYFVRWSFRFCWLPSECHANVSSTGMSPELLERCYPVFWPRPFFAGVRIHRFAKWAMALSDMQITWRDTDIMIIREYSAHLLGSFLIGWRVKETVERDEATQGLRSI